MPKFTLRIGNETVEFEAIRQGETLRLSRDGHTVSLQLIDRHDGIYTLLYQDSDGQKRQLRLAGVVQGREQRQLWLNGRYLSYQRVRAQTGAEGTAGSLSASIPAVVSQILVSEGDSVQAGDKLILLESMKMVIPIQAPYDGTVIRVACAAGDSVQAGVPLIELEEEDDE